MSPSNFARRPKRPTLVRRTRRDTPSFLLSPGKSIYIPSPGSHRGTWCFLQTQTPTPPPPLAPRQTSHLPTNLGPLILAPLFLVATPQPLLPSTDSRLPAPTPEPRLQHHGSAVHHPRGLCRPGPSAPSAPSEASVAGPLPRAPVEPRHPRSTGECCVVPASSTLGLLLTSPPQLPGVRCPTCAANGLEIWVIPGRACGNCGTPCF